MNEDFTIDHFYKKKVVVFQAKKGYRFSVDAPILADFVSPSTEVALEIGAGCGIVSLLVLYRKKFPSVKGIEIQKNLVLLGNLNAEKNGFSEKLEIVQGDFKKIYENFKGIKNIFSNPPFTKITTGRLSPNEEVRTAKFEVSLTLKELVEKSYSILGKEGNLSVILPYNRYWEFMEFAENTGFFVQKERFVFSFDRGKPERFLVKLSNYEVSQKKMEPLIIFKKRGIYTPEMEKILRGS